MYMCKIFRFVPQALINSGYLSSFVALLMIDWSSNIYHNWVIIIKFIIEVTMEKRGEMALVVKSLWVKHEDLCLDL